MKSFSKRYEEAIVHKYATNPEAEEDLSDRIEAIKEFEGITVTLNIYSSMEDKNE